MTRTVNGVTEKPKTSKSKKEKKRKDKGGDKYNVKVPPVVVNAVCGVIDIDDLTNQQKHLLTKAVLGYVLKIWPFNGSKDHTNMYDLLRNFIGWQQAQLVRQACSENFELMVSFRHVCYRLLQQDETSWKEVRRKFQRVGLSREDAQIYFRLHEYNLLRAALDQLDNALDDFKPPERVQRDFEYAIYQELDSNNQTLNSYILKFVKRKMRFILESYNMEVEDLASELRIKAAEAYYQKIPFASKQHIQNSLKQSIHNTGINLIHYYTTAKRGRLVQTDDGFQSKVHSMHISANEEGTEIGDLMTEDEDTDVSENTLTMRLSIVFLYDKLNIRWKRALRLLIRDETLLYKIAENQNKMVYHNINRNIEENRFLRWCYRELGTKYHDLNTLQAHVGNQRYLQLVKEYLGLDDDKFDDFVEKLKTQTV